MSIEATEQNVRLIGRSYAEDNTTWIPQSGSAIEFLATCTSLRLHMAGDDKASKGTDHRPRFAVLVNGEVVLDDTLSQASRIVEVPLGEALKDAIVEVIHLSEALTGNVGIRAIQVGSDSPTPVWPADSKDKSIAFVGDSITCGYGVESKNSDEPFRTTTENFMKSYAYLAAQELGYDYETVCYSGYGIISGWTAKGERETDMLVPPVYDLVTKGSDQKWDFAAHPRDVVVVNLGTNDSTYTGTSDVRIAEFAAAYTEFLGRVRELNPGSLIICTVGTMEGGELVYPAIEQAVSDHVSRTGDTRAHCYPSAPINVREDGCGAGGHPNEVSQRKAAKELVEAIRKYGN
ncbi:MAG: hypothetical protein IKF78_09160 [Atopobiaceae bacterium]|nr:hypothetical protein [Atopobiaceae bacterium]